MEPTEVEDAVRRAAAGEQSAWNALVASFGGLVWSIAVAHRLGPADAAEVSQTTWLRLVENLDRITQPERLGGWLATTARRESLRLLRQRVREAPTDDQTRLEPGVDSAAPTPESITLDRDRYRRLWRAYTLLPENCRLLLHLVVVDGLSYADIAATLDMRVGSIGPTRARCLERLRKLLAAGGMTSAAGGAC